MKGLQNAAAGAGILSLIAAIWAMSRPTEITSRQPLPVTVVPGSLAANGGPGPSAAPAPTTPDPVVPPGRPAPPVTKAPKPEQPVKARQEPAPVEERSLVQAQQPRIVLTVNREQDSSVPNVSVVLTKVEERQRRTRWYLEFRNGNAQGSPCFDIVRAQTYVSTKATLESSQIVESNVKSFFLQPLTKQTFWFDFELPLPEAETEYVVRITNSYPPGWLGCGNPQFEPFSVNLVR